MLLAAILIVGLPLLFLAAMIVCDKFAETDDEDSKTLMGALD